MIYANDNRGRWRSDFRQVFELSIAHGGNGVRISQQLAPDADDYFVLKPKHSAFFMTPLDLLLKHFRRAVEYFEDVLEIPTTPSHKVRFRAQR